MSIYITCHNGLGVDVADDAYWVNIVFRYGENLLMRTDGAVMTRVIERIQEKRFDFGDIPWDLEIRWCISLPVSGRHVNDENRTEDALQLAKWYKKQIDLGNATVNRALLFDMKPYHSGKNCCHGTVCDRILHPEWYGPPEIEWDSVTEYSSGGSDNEEGSSMAAKLKSLEDD